MVIRGWGAPAAAAVGTAAAAGAAQLGLAYGTGVVSWPTETGAAAEQAWVTSLAWGTWIAASSAIAGAVVAARLRLTAGEPGRIAQDRTTQVLWHLVLTIGAAVGALVTVALVAVRAREAVAAVSSAPQSVAAGYAVLGVCVGLLVAFAALAARAVANNLLATAAWLWIFAVVVVTAGVAAGDESTHAPLGFLEFDLGQVWFRNILLPDAGFALGAALVVGALTALPAARRGDHPIGVAVSGAAGPLVLAVTYLLAQPDLATVTPLELSRHVVAPYLVIAGLAGSLLVSAVPARREKTAAVAIDDAEPVPPEPSTPSVPSARTPSDGD